MKGKSDLCVVSSPGSLDLTGSRVSVCDTRQQHNWITGSVTSHNLLSKVREGAVTIQYNKI